MNCSNWGAALPAKSNLCTYCGTLNDTDLRALRGEASVGATTDRPHLVDVLGVVTRLLR